MTISMPSREVFVIDVPICSEFRSEFRYNFFVPDESVDPDTSVPRSALLRSGAERDSTFIQYAVTRVPRMNVLTWRPPRASFERVVNDSKAQFVSAQRGDLISKNVDKIMTEEDFATQNYVSLTFNDGNVDEKMYGLVSGSLTLLASSRNDNLDKKGILNVMASSTGVKSSMITRSLSQSKSTGTRFYDSDGRRIFDKRARRLKSVATSAQINGKFLSDLTGRSIVDPMSQHTTDLKNVHVLGKDVKFRIKSRPLDVSDSDYDVVLKHINISALKSSTSSAVSSVEVVGFIIDRTEVFDDGTTKRLQPIIIDGGTIASTVDVSVKYNASYVYTIRTIVNVMMNVVDVDTGVPSLAQVLVSSKPSTPSTVQTIETVAPPPPTDVGFVWNYDRINVMTTRYDQNIDTTGRLGSLMIHWSLPTNSQRDIKKFQVFRRSSVDEPFELLKQFDFDDSVVKFQQQEDVDPLLVEQTGSPRCFYFDDDFIVDKATSSRYIYAITSVDAHGLSSNYSAQFEVSFDGFKNRLEKRLISHTGAPKPYPNLYLDADTFVDAMHVSGEYTKKMRVIFNPELYDVIDDDLSLTKIVKSTHDNATYRFQFINVDNQKSATVTVTIDDRTTTVVNNNTQ